MKEQTIAEKAALIPNLYSIAGVNYELQKGNVIWLSIYTVPEGSYSKDQVETTLYPYVQCKIINFVPATQKWSSLFEVQVIAPESMKKVKFTIPANHLVNDMNNMFSYLRDMEYSKYFQDHHVQNLNFEKGALTYDIATQKDGKAELEHYQVTVGMKMTLMYCIEQKVHNFFKSKMPGFENVWMIHLVAAEPSNTYGGACISISDYRRRVTKPIATGSREGLFADGAIIPVLENGAETTIKILERIPLRGVGEFMNEWAVRNRSMYLIELTDGSRQVANVGRIINEMTNRVFVQHYLNGLVRSSLQGDQAEDGIYSWQAIESMNDY